VSEPTGNCVCSYSKCFPESRRAQYAALLFLVLKTFGGVVVIPWKLIIFLFAYGAIGVLLRPWWTGTW
jgi:hypothetical protein